MRPNDPGRAPRRLAAGLALILALCAGPRAPAQLLPEPGAEGVLSRWFALRGGWEAVVTPTPYAIDGTESWPDRATSRSLRVLRTREGMCRVEISEPNYKPLIQAWDGRIAWQYSPGLGYGLLAPEDVPQLRRDILLEDMDYGQRYVRRRLLGAAAVQGCNCQVIGMEDGEHVTEKWYFDNASGQLVRLERPGDARFPPMEVQWSDFRDVGGINLPFAEKARQGAHAYERHWSSVVTFPPLESSCFVLSTAQLADVITSAAILDKYESSLGDRGALAAIRSRVTRLQAEDSSSGTTSHRTIYRKLPNLVRTDTQTPGMGEVSEGFDGRIGWSRSEMEGYRLLKPDEAASLATVYEISNDYHLAERFPLRRLLGERTIDRHPTTAVALANLAGSAGTYYFDNATGRLLRIASATVGDKEANVQVTVDFSDYRRVDGVETAFVTTVTNPAMREVTTILSLKDNVPLDDTLFKAPNPH